jgi:hypothetical protein
MINPGRQSRVLGVYPRFFFFLCTMLQRGGENAAACFSGGLA